MTAEGDGQNQGPPGSGALGPKQGDRPRGARPLPSRCVTWKVTPARVALASPSVSPSPGPLLSPPASLPLRRPLHCPRRPPPPRKVLALPAAERHFRLCVPVRVRSRRPRPPGRPPVAGGVGKVTSRACSLCFGTRRVRSQGGPSRVGSALLFARNGCGGRWVLRLLLGPRLGASAASRVTRPGSLRRPLPAGGRYMQSPELAAKPEWQAGCFGLQVYNHSVPEDGTEVYPMHICWP